MTLLALLAACENKDDGPTALPEDSPVDPPVETTPVDGDTEPTADTGGEPEPEPEPLGEAFQALVYYGQGPLSPRVGSFDGNGCSRASSPSRSTTTSSSS